MTTHLRLVSVTSLLLFALSSCGSLYPAAEGRDASRSSWGYSRIPAPMKTTGATLGVPTYGTPLPLPGNETWMSSFTMTQGDSWFKDSDPFSEGGLAAKGSTRGTVGTSLQLFPLDVRWHNVAFVDHSTDEQWSLLDERAFLSRWWMLLETEEERRTANRMVFAATVSDTSGDGLLDDRDASVAIMTDGDGRNPRQITPSDAQLVTVRLYPERRVLGFELRFDEDGDGKFEEEEIPQMFFLPLSSDSESPGPWAPAPFKKSLEALYR